MNELMIYHFMSFSTVFQLHMGDGRVIMKGCEQLEIFPASSGAQAPDR